MAHGVGIVAFCGSLILGFALLGQYLEGLSGGAPAAASGATAGQADAVGLVEAGDAVFHGAGICFACHSLGTQGSAVRGPNLGTLPPQWPEPLHVRAEQRIPGKSAVEYLVESLYTPDAFVETGFQKGVMPAVAEPPMSLSHEQIRSVCMYMLDRSGVSVGPELEEEIRKAQAAFGAPPRGSPEEKGAGSVEDGTDVGFPPGDPAAGAARYQSLGCPRCHGERGGVAVDGAPVLFTGDRSHSELLVSIVRHAGPVDDADLPNVPELVSGLSVRGLADLIGFLRQTSEEEP